MIAFGPVPSRRLGRSLGVNNIPPKICSYSCVYCQLERTRSMEVVRRSFYGPERILTEVRDKVQKVRDQGESIDYLTFVPDGEPTLDLDLGEEIEALGALGIKIAVITNSSLMDHRDVRQALSRADWVSLKVDGATEEIWRRVDRPHGSLQLEAIQEGMLTFAREYQGVLATETMLVAGLNDGEDALRDIAAFLERLGPDRAYVSIPTRPPAEAWVHAPEEAAINRAYQIVSQRVEHVEYLIGYEGNEFAFTGDVEEDLLSITSVHPMREDAVSAFLDRADGSWDAVRSLLAQDRLVEVEHGDHRFYLRRLSRERRS